MKTIESRKELYTHTELEKLLNIGQNIMNERARNRKDGSINHYDKNGNLWRKGCGSVKYYEISEVKKELELRPYRKSTIKESPTESKEVVLLGEDTDGILKDIRELLAVLLEGQSIQIKGMLDMRKSLMDTGQDIKDLAKAWK
jgi:hypothetical protein